MRRRFGRGRRRNGGDENGSGEPLDAGVWLGHIAESGLAGVDALTPQSLPGVAPEAAVLGEGDGGELLVGYAPQGGEALFAVLALASARPAFRGRALAIAPAWSLPARRRLTLVGSPGFALRGIAAPQLGGASGEVEPAPLAPPLPVAPERIAAGIERDEERELFFRALAGVRGLAAKHGGAVRGLGDRVDLLLLARTVATLRAARGSVRLELSGPDRANLDLAGEGLATALDRLEGSLRKRLNDRRVRSSEEGLRASLLPVLERAAGLRSACAWPLAASDAGPVDLVGVDGQGRLTVAAGRERLDLAALGETIDAALDPSVQWPLLSGESAPAAARGPRLLLAAREHDDAALRLLPLLSIEAEVFSINARRGAPLRIERVELPERSALTAPESASEPTPTPTPTPMPTPTPKSASAPEPQPTPRPEPAQAEPARAERARPERARPERVRPEAAAPAAAESSEEGGPPASSGIEELSLFDLDEGTERDSGPPSSRRRRSRGGRRRGRRGQSAGAEAGAEGGESGASESESQPAESGRRSSRRTRREEPPAAASDSEDDELVDEDGIAALADDAPEPEESVDLRYEDEDASEEGDAEADAARRERELRRRARIAKAEPEPPKPPRRRAAFVAHADRISVLTAVLLARDVRLVESFWVYPQEDLMTFFRSVATDLGEETPIFLIGFNASPPTRDTLQAASLYRGRLHWFDHHEWPPEDLVALGEAIGTDAVHVEAGAESSLASVIGERTRRSRFSDKLVELVTGRFTSHDYERWGRLWWHRAGEIAGRPGDRRRDIDALLAGRPSDLAKESARQPVPPPPPEVEYVSSRDFRLVHFGGFVMVVLDVPEGLDLHLAGRIARERYEAVLSLAGREDGELLVLGGDESRTRRGLDLGGMAAHLASKHEWITALADDDHVARIRVEGLRTVPGRLDEVVSEIAMGRSIVEA